MSFPPWAVSPIETVLLTYPRSGNTWTRYCIEYLTGMPTNGICKVIPDPHDIVKHTQPIGCIVDIGINTEANAVAHKFHKLPDGLNNGTVGLIVVVRNYKECIIRHKCYNISNTMLNEQWMQDFSNAVNGDVSVVDYIGCLACFHVWSGKKLMLYYEDILDDPRGFLTTLSDFLGVGLSRIPGFMAEYEKHRKQSVSVYEGLSTTTKSFTRGKAKKFHSKLLTKEERLELDRIVREKHPYLFQEYLKRYEEA